MKRISKTILALTFIAILFSCSDDDNETPININDLIGVWELNSITSNGEELIENPDCLDRYTFTASDVNYVEYFDFDDNNGCVIVPGQDLDQTVPYSVQGTNITFGDGGFDSYTYEIINLNSTTLVLRDVYTDEGITYTDIETYNKL